MEKIKIVFMGTPEFAVATLEKLLYNDHDVVGVVTAPDKPAGRGRRLHESAIKLYAKAHNLKILQPTNLKDKDFLEALASLGANLQIVVAFRMLPKEVWSMPQYGTFNLHASLLPKYRGAAPINWAIINGESETGVTTFFIDDKIDTGEIILQKKTTIGENDTAGTLHDKLMVLGSDLVCETVRQIENNSVIRKKQQTDKESKLAYKIHKETCRIDWNESLESIYNHIRGLCPYPGAWTTMVNDGDKIIVKIFETFKEKESHGHENGKIVFNKKEMRIAVEDGFINLQKIQLPGKRKMNVNEVLIGLNLAKSAHMV